MEEPPKPDPDDPQERSAYLQKMNQIHIARANNHSDRCSVNYKLEIARAVSFIFLKTDCIIEATISSWLMYSTSLIIWISVDERTLCHPT